MKKLFIATLVLATFATTTNGQATASASAFAVIVTPISIANVSGEDLNFGNIATNGVLGDVVIAANVTPTRSFGTQGGLTFPAITGAFRAAKFTVSGNVSYSYAITLPGSAITLTSGLNTMTVDEFTTDAATDNTTGVLSAGGTDLLFVGGKLHVGTNQAAGSYSVVGGLSLTVNYN